MYSRLCLQTAIFVQGMSCWPTKLSYLITFGIAPYFKQLLVEDLKKAACFVVLFDDSLNTELHQEQIDFTVRYFKKDQVMTRYLSWAFLGHTTAKDLKLKFEEATKNLDTNRMVQALMDGPNTNWKMLSKITEERSSTEHYPGLINVGSCSLHVVHGAFRSVQSKTKWGIDMLLNVQHNLFDESFAKREDYIKITGSDILPLQFCDHRWLEDKGVAERALQMWPKITAYIIKTLKESNSYIKYMFYNEVCCPGQLNNCKGGIFCISCSHPETLSGDLSVWCSTSVFYHLRTSSNAGNWWGNW